MCRSTSSPRPELILAKSDEPMCIGHVSIERQRLPALGDTIGDAVGLNLNCAEQHVGSGMVWRTKQHAVQGGLRGLKMRVESSAMKAEPTDTST